MKKYIVPKVDNINIDVIDEAWGKIEAGVLLDNRDGSKADIKTLFRLAYNDNGDLFFMFDADDDHPNVTMAGYNNPIYDEETVEFFFATERDKTNYLELEWNALGGEFAANIDNDLRGHTTLHFIEQNPLKSKVIKRDGGFFVVGKIDKSAFKGDKAKGWLFNAYRIKRREDNSMKLYAYSPTIIEQFHRPDYFVELEFAE